MPRAVHLLLAAVVLVSLGPAALGAPLVPDTLVGGATAVTFQIFGHGAGIEGGAFDWTNICAHCSIRMTISTLGLQVVDATSSESALRQLPPGQYEVREYRGLFGLYEVGPHHYEINLAGTGKVTRLS